MNISGTEPDGQFCINVPRVHSAEHSRRSRHENRVRRAASAPAHRQTRGRTQGREE